MLIEPSGEGVLMGADRIPADAPPEEHQAARRPAMP